MFDRKEYSRQYNNKKYHGDPVFREKLKQAVKRYYYKSHQNEKRKQRYKNDIEYKEKINFSMRKAYKKFTEKNPDYAKEHSRLFKIKYPNYHHTHKGRNIRTAMRRMFKIK